jgi:hypothetical protein
LPKPAAVPVEIKLPQEAHASGHNPSRVNKLIFAVSVMILDFMLSPLLFGLGKVGRAFSVSLK